MSATYTDDDVRIVEFPATPIAVMEYRGDHRMMGDAIRRFVDWRKARGFRPPKYATFNRFYTDPDEVAPEDYRLDICVALKPGDTVAANDMGITLAEIPAGDCAVIRQTGGPDNLRDSFGFIYGDWLPRSGRDLRDCPVFAERVSLFPNVPEHEAITDIYLPLK